MSEEIEEYNNEYSNSEPKAVKHIDDGSDRSISSKQTIRRQLQEDIELFLKKGGSVQRVGTHITADPPKKPSSNYGSRPI